MKFVLLATIVAMFAFANAVRMYRDDVDTVRQNTDQLRQCTCDEQYLGIREWKDAVVQCHDQCRIDLASVFRTVIDTPVKIYSCLDHKVNMIHRLFDCVNDKLIQTDSCSSNVVTGGQGQGQSLNTQEDFRQLIVRFIDPLYTDFQNTMDILDQQIGQQQQKLGKNLLGLNECASTCVANKIKQTRHWEQVNCLPKVNQNMIQQHIQTCAREMDLKKTIHKVCTCAVQVGVSDLQPYCQKLRTLKFPQWAQGVSYGLQGMDMYDNDQQLFGQSSQFGQNLRGQKMIVKLAIEQNQPDIQGSTDFDQDQGSFGGQDYQRQQLGGQGYQRSLGGLGYQRSLGGIGGQRSFGGQGYQGSIGSTGYQSNKYQSASGNLGYL